MKGIYALSFILCAVLPYTNTLWQQWATESVAEARQKGGSMAELSARLFGGRHTRRTLYVGQEHSVANESSTHTESSSTRTRLRALPLNAVAYRDRLILVNEDGLGRSTAASGISMSRRGSGVSNVSSICDVRTPIAECRDKSKSAWLHFPHFELVFLFFAYEGAVASQAYAIRHVGLDCPSMVCTAVAVLVGLYAVAYQVKHPCNTKLLQLVRAGGDCNPA